MAQYEELGVAIKMYRVAADESIEDVSGAVEIEPDSLTKIESGELQPPSDILELIISHFALREGEAARLWDLAGYDNTNNQERRTIIDKTIEQSKVTINTTNDSGIILYTDMIHVISNRYGVVINFIQGVGTDGKPNIISRVGMSREHAESMVEVLKKSLEKNADS